MPNDIKFTASNIKRFPRGGVIVQEHDETTKEMYILLQGNVGIYKNFRLNSEVQLKVLSQGSFWGEMSLFLGSGFDSSYVALSDVIVLAINRKNVYDFFALQSDMTFTIIEDICKRLNAQNEIIAKTQKEDTTQSASRRSTLFPDGHGSYLLPLNNTAEALYDQKVNCPLCGHSFISLTVISSKLRLERTDPDMRARYKDIEPLYYDIVTCPNCFFSATNEAFPTVSKKMADAVNQKVGPYKLDMYIRTGSDKDTFTVFAGYYLAILCASVCFDDYQMITGNLWQKVSRLYQDCGDDKLFAYATEQSLKDYLYSYENFRISDKLLPQLCYVIGDLFYRKDDLDNARNYFFMARTNPAIGATLKRQAENRIEEIKARKKSD